MDDVIQAALKQLVVGHLGDVGRSQLRYLDSQSGGYHVHSALNAYHPFPLVENVPCTES